MTGKDRQTVADAAVVMCGSGEAIFEVARRNDIAIDAEINGVVMEGCSVMSDETVGKFENRYKAPATEYKYEPEPLSEGGNIITTNNGEEITL